MINRLVRVVRDNRTQLLLVWIIGAVAATLVTWLLSRFGIAESAAYGVVGATIGVAIVLTLEVVFPGREHR